MTIKELKQKLENVPDDMDVMIMQTDDEFSYIIPNKAEVRNVKFLQGDDEEDLEPTIEKCFVITDEY